MPITSPPVHNTNDFTKCLSQPGNRHRTHEVVPAAIQQYKGRANYKLSMRDKIGKTD